jgi:GxxExxY protein
VAAEVKSGIAAKERKNHRILLMKTINELCDVVRETSYAVHVYHGHGHLEKVYENALAHRLRKLGYDVKQQFPIQVRDEDGTPIGDYLADLMIDNSLILELKATKTLADEHLAQLLGYLKSTRVEHGMLINFGSYKFQVRKYALSQTTRSSNSGGITALVSTIFALFCG